MRCADRPPISCSRSRRRTSRAPACCRSCARTSACWAQSTCSTATRRSSTTTAYTVGTTYRPGWSLELHLQANVVGSSPVIRREAVIGVDGFAGRRDAGLTQELALRLHDGNRRIRHRPAALVRRRAPELPDVDPAVVVGWSARRGEAVEVEPQSALPGALRLVREVKPHTRVSIVIPTRGTEDPGRGPARYLVESLIESMERTTGRDRVTGTRVRDRLRRGHARAGSRALDVDRHQADEVRGSHAGAGGVQFRRHGQPRAPSSPHGDVLVFVNDDVAMLSEGWLHEVVPLAVLPDVGAVGIRLLFPDRTIQHLGLTSAAGGWRLARAPELRPSSGRPGERRMARPHS